LVRILRVIPATDHRVVLDPAFDAGKRAGLAPFHAPDALQAALPHRKL